MTLDLEAFRATKRPCDDTTWAQIVEAELLRDIPTLTQAACTIYGAECWLIHEQDGKFFVHAWWYAPLSYDTLEEAEAKLHPWYLEFV